MGRGREGQGREKGRGERESREEPRTHTPTRDAMLLLLSLTLALPSGLALHPSPLHTTSALCSPPVRMGLMDEVQSAAGKVKDTMKGVKAAYEDDDFVPAGFVRARHILFLRSDDADAKAEALASRIEAGEISFPNAALLFSACPTRDLNGSLGTFTSLSRLGEGTLRGDSTPYDGQDTKAFDDLVFSPMTPLRKVCKVQTQWGTHLVFVEERGGQYDDVGFAEQVVDGTARLVAQATRPSSDNRNDNPQTSNSIGTRGFGGQLQQKRDQMKPPGRKRRR